MADIEVEDSDLATAVELLAHLERSGRQYRGGVLEAVGECISKMRGQPRGAIVDAVARQFKQYELDRLEVWQTHGLAVIEEMRGNG